MQGSTTIEYELGSPNPNENDYSSTDGQVLCVAEAASDPGVEHFDMIQMGQGVFAESPQPMWQLGKMLPDLAVTDPKGAAANGGPISGPVALSRAHGSGWNEDALTLFQSGLVAATGTYTGNTRLYFKLQSNQKPVAVALTNESERSPSFWCGTPTRTRLRCSWSRSVTGRRPGACRSGASGPRRTPAS